MVMSDTVSAPMFDHKKENRRQKAGRKRKALVRKDLLISAGSLFMYL
jgi:hypothetical protein